MLNDLNLNNNSSHQPYEIAENSLHCKYNKWKIILCLEQSWASLACLARYQYCYNTVVHGHKLCYVYLLQYISYLVVLDDT